MSSIVSCVSGTHSRRPVLDRLGEGQGLGGSDNPLGGFLLADGMPNAISKQPADSRVGTQRFGHLGLKFSRAPRDSRQIQFTPSLYKLIRCLFDVLKVQVGGGHRSLRVRRFELVSRCVVGYNVYTKTNPVNKKRIYEMIGRKPKDHVKKLVKFDRDLAEKADALRRDGETFTDQAEDGLRRHIAAREREIKRAAKPKP